MKKTALWAVFSSDMRLSVSVSVEEASSNRTHFLQAVIEKNKCGIYGECVQITEICETPIIQEMTDCLNAVIFYAVRKCCGRPLEIR